MKKPEKELDSNQEKTQPESEIEIPVEGDEAADDEAQLEAADREAGELCEEDRLRQQVAELEDKLLRTAAEFDNYRKRVARQYEDMMRTANDGVLLELLEVVDNFERALNHGADNPDFESYRKGIELIFNQVKNLLERYDVTPIEAVGQPFDPNLHEAMMQIESGEYDDGIVAMEMARGYLQGKRVLRHSKVGVSTGKKEDDDN